MFFITVTAHVSCRQCLQLSTELQTHKNNGNAVNINISASLRRARDGTRIQGVSKKPQKSRRKRILSTVAFNLLSQLISQFNFDIR